MRFSPKLLAALLTILTSPALARVTAPGATDADIWCAGPTSFEDCVDKLGNMIPTTDNTQTLGTSALRWSNIYGVSAAITSALNIGTKWQIGVYGNDIRFLEPGVSFNVTMKDGGLNGINTISPATALDVYNIPGGTLALSMGAYQTWVPVITGYTDDPNHTCPSCRYKLIGNMLCIDVDGITGTSNATTLTLTLPFKAGPVETFPMMGFCQDSGTSLTAPCLAYTTAGSTTLTIRKDLSQAAFTNSGTKTVYLGNVCMEVTLL